jgi:hypothetical protein
VVNYQNFTSKVKSPRKHGREGRIDKEYGSTEWDKEIIQQAEQL